MRGGFPCQHQDVVEVEGMQKPELVQLLLQLQLSEQQMGNRECDLIYLCGTVTPPYIHLVFITEHILDEHVLEPAKFLKKC